MGTFNLETNINKISNMQLIDQYGWLIPLFPCLSALILGIGLLSFRRGTRSLRWASAAISIAF
jgi:hypothetical protein